MSQSNESSDLPAPRSRTTVRAPPLRPSISSLGSGAGSAGGSGTRDGPSFAVAGRTGSTSSLPAPRCSVSVTGSGEGQASGQ